MSPSSSSDLAGSPGPPLNSYPPRVRESETQVDPTPSSAAHSTTILNSNASTLASVDDIYYFYKPEQMTFLWILLAMIVVGNSWVLFHITLFAKNRKSRMNFFIKHLAFADLLVGVINVSTDIAWRITVDWRAGDVLCKAVKFLQVLVTYSSTYVLVSLSIDRYDAIKNPLNLTRRWKKPGVLIGMAWGLSVIFSLPAIILNRETIVQGHPQCWIDLESWQWRMYITLVAISLFFIPAIIIAACYCIIVNTIWRKSRGNLANYSTTDSSSVATTVYIRASSGATESTTIGSSISKPSDQEGDNRQRVSSRGVFPKAKIKSVWMTFVIVLVFILCWSPYFVWDLLQVYGFIPLTQQTIAISTFIQSLAPLNSAANPIIYGLFSRRTRNPSTYVTCSTCCTTTSTTSTSSTNTACCYK